MDDSRLANLLFLTGFASLALPGCGGDGEPGRAPAGGAPGNPLASPNSLGDVDASDACTAYILKLIECSGGYDDYEYGSGDYYGASVVPGYTDYCDAYLSLFASQGGRSCVSAAADYFSCLSTLSCQALGEGSSACGGAFSAIEAACGGVEVVDDDGE